jgi:hypothetical protein
MFKAPGQFRRLPPSGAFGRWFRVVGVPLDPAAALESGDWTLTAAQTRPDGGELLVAFPDLVPEFVRWTYVAEPGPGDWTSAARAGSSWTLGQFQAGEHTVWLSLRSEGEALSPISLTSKSATLLSYDIDPAVISLEVEMVAGQEARVDLRQLFDLDPLWSEYPLQLHVDSADGGIPPYIIDGDDLVLSPPSDWPALVVEVGIKGQWPDAAYATVAANNPAAPTIAAAGGTVTVSDLGTCAGAPQPWVHAVRWEVDGDPVAGETGFVLADRVEGEDVQQFLTWRGPDGSTVEIGSNVVTIAAVPLGIGSMAIGTTFEVA